MKSFHGPPGPSQYSKFEERKNQERGSPNFEQRHELSALGDRFRVFRFLVPSLGLTSLTPKQNHIDITFREEGTPFRFRRASPTAFMERRVGTFVEVIDPD